MAIEVYVPEGYDLPEDEDDRTYYFGIGESQAATLSWIGFHGSGWEGVTAIDVANDTDLIAVGYTTLYDDGTGVDVNNDDEDDLYSIGGYDGIISYYDAEGANEWCYTFGGTQDEMINDVYTCEDGSFVIVGYTSSDDIYYAGEKIDELSISSDNENLAKKDGFIIKLSDDGSYTWGVRLGGIYDDEITAVTETQDTNIAVVGTYYSDTLYIYSAGNLETSVETLTKGNSYTNYENAFLISFTDNGEYSWSQNITSSYDTQAVDIIALDDGLAIGINYLGSSSYPVYLNTSKTTSQVGDSTSYSNGLVVGYDLDGNYSWRYRFYPSSSSYNAMVTSLACGTDGEVYATVNHNYILYGGQNGSTGDVIYNSTSTSSGYFSSSVVELGSTGSLISHVYTLNGTYDNYISTIDISEDGEILIGGWFYATSDFDADGDEETDGDYDFNAITGAYTSDAFSMLLDDTGEVHYTSQIYGDGYDIVNSVHFIGDEAIEAGTFTSTSLYVTNVDEDGEEETNDGNSDGFINYGVTTGTEIAEKSSITVENYLKEFTITTEVIEHDEDGVSIEGGSITGKTGTYEGTTYKESEILYVETVTYNEDGTQDIVITPDEGYVIKEITINGVEYTEYVLLEDGTVTISAFTSVTEDIHVTVEFSSTIGAVEVNHLLWTEDEGLTTTQVAESEDYTGEEGSSYETTPNTDIDYEIITNSDYYGDDLPDGVDGDDYYIPENYTGTYIAGTTQIVNYYYKEKTYTLTVYHYIDGTNTPVPLKGTETNETVPEEYYEGYYKNDEYTTSQASEDLIDYNIYELSVTPDNAQGTITEDTYVTYYYKEKEVDLSLTKVGETTETTLEGVTFNLYKQICSDNHSSDLIGTTSYDEECFELIGTYTSDENGIISISSLAITGVYRLVEISTVDGYVLPDGEWQIEFDYGQLDEDEIVYYNEQGIKITSVSNPPAISLIDDTLYLYNMEGYDLPLSGSSIQNLIYYSIIAFIIALIAFILRKKSMKKTHLSKHKISSLRKSILSARNIAENYKK